MIRSTISQRSKWHKELCGYFGHAAILLQLPKRNFTKASCDLLQHAGHFGIQCFGNLDGTKPRLAPWKTPEEWALSRGVRQGSGNT